MTEPAGVETTPTPADDALVATGRYALYRTPDGGFQLLVDTAQGRDGNGKPVYSEQREFPIPPMILNMANMAAARFGGDPNADPMAMINGLLGRTA